MTIEDDHESLRARSEQALGEIAQALVENPTLHNAIAAAFGAREKAIEAQQAAMSALNLSSATDVERVERRLRSLSQRLEDVEEQLDEANRELAALRRRAERVTEKQAEKPKRAGEAKQAERPKRAEPKQAEAEKPAKKPGSAEAAPKTAADDQT